MARHWAKLPSDIWGMGHQFDAKAMAPAEAVEETRDGFDEAQRVAGGDDQRDLKVFSLFQRSFRTGQSASSLW